MPLASYTHDEGPWAIVRTPNGEKPETTPVGTKGYSGTRRGVTFVDGECRVPLEADTDDYEYCRKLLSRFAYDDGYAVVLPTGESLERINTARQDLEHREEYRKLRVRATAHVDKELARV